MSMPMMIEDSENEILYEEPSTGAGFHTISPSGAAAPASSCETPFFGLFWPQAQPVVPPMDWTLPQSEAD